MSTQPSAASLDGRVALVTGGGSGLGAAFSRRLARDGALVIVNDLTDGPARAVADSIGGEHVVFDVADAAAVDRAVDGIVERYGRIDILVNNAGIAPTADEARTHLAMANQLKRMEGRIGDMEPPNATVGLSDDEWGRMFRVHVDGTFHGTRAALRHMTPARSGAIVNIASVLGLRPMAGAPHYSAAKAAVIALTKSIGQEVAPFGVRVNVVCPGWVDTPLLAPMDPMLVAGVVMQIPQGRLAGADELAELVRFLCGPESSYASGDVFTASGGFV
jgi:3-oxoacyl-[acyl-carrier protein] reductase